MNAAVDEVGGPNRRLLLSFGAVGPLMTVFDVILISAASIAAGAGYHLVAFGTSGDLAQFLAIAAVAAALFVPFARLRGLYRPAAILDRNAHVLEAIGIWLCVILFLIVVAFALKIGQDFSRGAVLAFVTGGAMVLGGHRLVWRWVLSDALASGRLGARRVLLVSEPGYQRDGGFEGEFGAVGLAISHDLAFPEDPGADLSDLAAEVLGLVRGSDIEEIFIASGIGRLEPLGRLLAQLRVLPVPIRFVPDAATSMFVGRPAEPFGSRAAVELQRAPLSRTERAAKRVLDLAFGIGATIVLLPLLVTSALAVRIDSPGPVLFRQQRHGFNGVRFRILKFRSMTVQEDGAVVQQARREDPRVTRVGVWLRRLSIDELPQLFNVLAGDMSIVGPRPHAVAHDNYYDDLISDYAFRHHVKPGLTGWAQINGSRGETPTVESMARRVELDRWYIDNWTIWLDVRIIFRTVLELARSKGVY